MATIVNSMVQGLTQPMIQARLQTADAKPFKFGQYFPVKKVNGFQWKTLTNQIEQAHVAADLQSDNATVQRKRRPVFEVAHGDIPFISISRDWTRSEIKDYQTALAFAASNAEGDASQLVDYWGNDVDFCFDGVQSELEFIAWQLFSNAGILHFDTTKNATFANEFDLDYQVDDENKVATGTNWANNSKAAPIDDLVKIVRDARKRNLNPKFAFVNMDEFYKLATTEQIIKKCATIAQNLTGTQSTPDLAGINSMLAREANLYGLQLRIIDQTITREFSDGSQTSANPFSDTRLVLTETERLGRTLYDVLQENQPTILRAVRAHTVIKRYGTIEPLSEVTIGQADAIPVFDTAYRNIYVKTDAKEWE